MTPEIAQATIQFMLRVQLHGQEVPAFNAVMQALQSMLKEPVAQEPTNKGAEQTGH